MRLGDKYWTRQHFNELGHFNYDEILFYNGSLIAMDSMSRKVLILEMVLELKHHLKLRAKMHSLPLPMFGEHHEDGDEVYVNDSLRSLVEWRGELYLVFHEMIATRLFTAVSKTTTAFHVYKFDSRWDLVKVKNFEDGMIFLVSSRPKCFSVKDFSPALNLKGNCIYYSNQNTSHTNIFCLEAGKWEPFPSFCFPGSLSMWYTPRICY
ncbi:hypothetical protein AAC387_Pa04g2000 [Persea americana]